VRLAELCQLAPKVVLRILLSVPFRHFSSLLRANRTKRFETKRKCGHLVKCTSRANLWPGHCCCVGTQTSPQTLTHAHAYEYPILPLSIGHQFFFILRWLQLSDVGDASWALCNRLCVCTPAIFISIFVFYFLGPATHEHKAHLHTFAFTRTLTSTSQHWLNHYSRSSCFFSCCCFIWFYFTLITFLFSRNCATMWLWVGGDVETEPATKTEQSKKLRARTLFDTRTHTHTKAYWQSKKCYYNLLLISFAAQRVSAKEIARWPLWHRTCACVCVSKSVRKSAKM